MSTMQPYDGTEADAMDDSGYECELDPNCLSDEELQEREERREDAMAATRIRMTTAYNTAKNARVGSTIACPVCGKHITKTTYHKVFCSNSKTAKRGRNNCKDRYWNSVDPERSFRAQMQ